MKRCFGALALLVTVAGLAHAEFIVIRVNLGVPPAPADKDKNPMNPMGLPIPPGGIGKKMPGPGPVVKGADADPAAPLTIVAVVEYDKIGKGQPTLSPAGNVVPGRYYFPHKWSQKVKGTQLVTDLWADDRVIQIEFFKHQSQAQETKEKRDELGKKKDKGSKDYLERAEWALGRGLLDEFKSYMDDLLKTEVKEPSAAAIVKAYKQVKDDLQKSPGRDDAAIVWKERYKVKAARSEHYVMLYDAPSNAPTPDVNSRLDRLEKNYQQFFYWFAMRGQVLPMPDRKLVAFLVDTAGDFREYHSAFDRVPMVADGFFARRDNLIVLSTERTDEPSVVLNAHLKAMVQSGWNLKSLLAGERRYTEELKGKFPDEIATAVAYAQTLALVHKVLAEESEVATISHEGTCQLLAATGLLPRTVVAPEWVQFGLPSVWDTAKFDPILRTGAFWHGFGMPSWTHQLHYKVLEANKELPPTALQALEAVLMDQDFRWARRSRDPVDMLKARTMSWALCYFLVQRHLDGLQRYSQELAALPRDLELDDGVTILCFARAFKLVDANNQMDQAKFRNFANEWFKYMEIVPLPMGRKPLDEAQKALKELKEMREKLPGGSGVRP